MSYINHLHTFVTVYRCGSVSAAAGILHITQPTISAQLRSLETRLGKRLFIRSGQGIVATADAEELANAIGSSLDRIDEVLRAMLSAKTGASGTVNLGGPVEFIQTMLLPQLQPLLDAGIKLRFSFGVTGDLLELLRNGSLDFVIATGPSRHKIVESLPIYEEDFILAAPPELAKELPPIDSAAQAFTVLDCHPVLAYAEHLPMLRRYCKTVFGLNPHFKAAMIIPDLRGLLTAVESGAGLSVLPRYLCRASLDSGRIVELFATADRPVNTLHFAWNIKSIHNPLNARACELLLAIFKEIA